jgi:hypothetical protein
MKTTFEELKAELLLKAKNNNACESGYTQAENCKTKKELVQVIANYFNWVWETKTITIEDLNKFNSDLLQSIGIFINYEGTIKSDSNKLIIVGSSSSPTIETYDSSSPTIETYDSSSPTIETYASSSPRIETYASSSPTIITHNSSSPRIITHNSSSPLIETYDSSSPLIEAYSSSRPRIETHNSSSATIITYDSSSPRIITYDSSSMRIEGINNCIIEQNLSMIIDLDNLVIYKSYIWGVE